MNHWRTLLLSACLVMLCAGLGGGQEAKEKGTGGALLRLSIGVDIDVPGVALIFMANNASEKNIETTPIGTSANWLEVQTPDGRTENIREMVRIGGPTVIEGGKSKSWRFDLVRDGGVKFDGVSRDRPRLFYA